jgi:HEAT repeat protein
MDAIGQVDPSFRSKGSEDMNRLLDVGVNTFTKLMAAASNEAFEPELRSIACWFLSRLGDDRAVPVLLKCLNDKNASLRSEAARSLGTMGRVEAAPMLVETLKHDASEDVRLHAIYALGLLRDEVAREPILETLLDVNEKPEVRGMAAETLSFFPGQRTVETLIACLSDPQAEVRYWCAFALGQLGAEQALPALRQLALANEASLPDERSVRSEAAEAIETIQQSNCR